MASSLPTLVIVGRPNVGKSTLFNRIVGMRISVVQDTPGVTRDRIYAEATVGRRRFMAVDTGGILFSDDDPLIEQIRIQAEVAVAEASAVLFMVDVENGLTSPDWELAQRLRQLKVPMFLVANKADNPGRVLEAQEFAALGMGPVHAVSAVHGHGVDDLLEEALKTFPKDLGEDEGGELRLAIIGRPNVGKSSMLNAFSREDRSIVSSIPGTTRDTIDSFVTWQGRAVRLIDTAGIRRRGKVQGSIEYYMVLRAQRALQRAECALLVVDGLEGLTDGDKRVAQMSYEMGKPLVIAVNKWDLREPPAGNLGQPSMIKKDFKRIVQDELPSVSYAPIIFTSAQERAGLNGVMNAVFRAVESWNFRIPTGPLNRLVQDAIFEKPLTRKGNPVRIRFATQPETCPPTIILFANHPDLVHFSYQRYIENQIRKKHPMEGTPVRMHVRGAKEKD
jgi:GTP-binding protein